MPSARRGRLVALLLCATGCGNEAATPSSADMMVASLAPPALDGVTESFAPSRVPVGKALGIAAQIALGADAPSQAKRKGELDRLASVHAALLRRDFLFSDLEPQKGQFALAGEDAAVDDTVARGIATVGLLVYGSPWASAGGDVDTPPDHDAFAAWAGVLAARYRGRVAAWEIWNEENAGYRFWHPKEDPAAYADLLARAAAAIRAADPGATVVLGGLFYYYEGIVEGAEDFLVEAYQARPDLGRSFDALGIHPYPRSYPGVTPPEFASRDGKDRSVALDIARLRALLAHYGDGAKPIWVTELGWPIYGAVDEPAQARFLVRASVELLAAGADRVCTFTLDDGAHPDAFPPEDAFGVFKNDGTAKQAAGALATLATIDPAAVLDADRSSAGLRDYVFKGPASRFRVLFATDGAMHPVDATGASRALDVEGRPLATAHLQAGDDPIYVVY